ncbi:hypothetical protein Ndes2526B_g00630 [Nannochloris sp. 'desiccata']
MEPEIKPSSSSSSGLEFQLHPLVLINISDHHTRNKVNAPPDQGSAPARVVGCLLGEQSGRSVSIRNSFEVGNTFPEDANQLDIPFLYKKLEQYKQTFPQLDVIGWYATGSAVGSVEMDIQRKIMELNESPVFLLLDTTTRGASSAAASDQLPVSLFESELHVVEGNPSFTFVQASFTIATEEAERIGVDQVSKLLPSGNAVGTDQLTAHLGGLHSAASMLTSKIETIIATLTAMQDGRIPFDPAIARQCAAIAARLPAADTTPSFRPSKIINKYSSSSGGGSGFSDQSAVETCDAMLSVLLAGVTMGTAQVANLADKHNLAYERIGGGPVSKRGGGGGGGGGKGVGVFGGGMGGAMI